MHVKNMTLPCHFTIGFVMLATAWQVAAQSSAPTATSAPVFRIALSSGITNALVQRAGANVWDPAYDGQLLGKGDRLQTRANARLALICPDGTTLRIGEWADLEIQAEPESPTGLALFVHRAKLYFFHRGGPTHLKLRTRTASAAVRGTEFEFDAEEDGTAQIVVLDGEVAFQNALGEVMVANGEQATAVAGQPPKKTAVIEAVNIIQWCLYYPAILDLEDLRFEPEALVGLKESLSRYREGNLLAALAAYPNARNGAAASESIYQSALLLAVGKVLESEALLSTIANSPVSQAEIDRNLRLADALRKLVASVKMQSWRGTWLPASASEWLAESYYRQAQADLAGALAAARQATVLSPRFGFAWERVAELEFGFARHAATAEALSKALALSPDNAQAWALEGFVLAARNDTKAAINSFARALATDSALGNAWLGRGLCRIRRGDLKHGLEDLQTAVVSEPRRAVLRSYLGKGFASAKEHALAAHELKLAISLDPNDPTGWLYSALLNQQQNRINEAIEDLQASQKRNDNRSLFRSRLLLDEDRAVGSANLASIYRDAGLAEVSLREAARAVSYDFANASAHLFLSDAYNDLRDPTRFSLRYETVWFNELLLANLLSPVGGGRLSQAVSQQEYSRLFEADGLRLASSTAARSDGSFHQLASQYGTFGNTSYALDLDYRHNNGVRPNNVLDSTEWYSTIKQQITLRDTALMLVKYEDYHSGDNFQYYDPRQARPHFSFDENQDPILVGAWHHEWSPGMHTMFLGGRLINEQRFRDRNVPQIVLLEDAAGTVDGRDGAGMDVDYRNSLQIYAAELNQICDWSWITLSAGARYQAGEFQTGNLLENPTRIPFLLPNPANGSTKDGFERITGYGYVTLKPVEPLQIIGGLVCDQETIPSNFRHPPVTPGEEERSQVGPKAGFFWTPLAQATLRGAYTRSLGGVSLDESYRLEPTQLAGFPQAFRTLIPESTPGVGSVSAPVYEALGLALDLKLGSRTFAGFQAERLTSDVRRRVGVFTVQNGNTPATADSIAERLGFEERSLAMSVNQLLGDQFVAGSRYKLALAELDDAYPATPRSVLTPAFPSQRAALHQATGYLLFNHPSGFFARVEAQWHGQRNSGYSGALPGDAVVQENIYVGYRFPRGHGELQLGLLNLTGADYRLNPLSAYEEMPRERVFEARLSFRF